MLASLAAARAAIERWRLDDNQVRPHSAHRRLIPTVAHIWSAGDRLRNRDQLRRSPGLSFPLRHRRGTGHSQSYWFT